MSTPEPRLPYPSCPSPGTDLWGTFRTPDAEPNSALVRIQARPSYRTLPYPTLPPSGAAEFADWTIFEADFGDDDFVGECELPILGYLGYPTVP